MNFSSSFTEVFRALSLLPSLEANTKHLSTVKQIAQEIRSSQGLDLLRLYLGQTEAVLPYAAPFRAEFQKESIHFPPSGNAFEMRILAGATLLAMLSLEGNQASTTVALAIASVYQFGWSIVESASMDLNSPAQQYLWEHGEKARVKTESLDMQPAKEKVQKGIASLQRAPKEETEETANPSASSEVRSLSSNWKSLSGLLTNASIADACNRELWEEEISVLWWLLQATHCRHSALDGVNRNFAAFLAGQRLAALILRLPGPLWARGFLHTVVCNDHRHKEQNISISHALKDAPHEWKNQWIAEKNMTQVLDLCPVASTTALSNKMANYTLPRWFNPSFQAEKSVTLSDIAYQVYIECLLSQSI